MTPITTFATMPNQEPFFSMSGGMPFPPSPHVRQEGLPPGFHLPHGFMPGMGSPALQAQAALLSRNMLPLPAQPQENMLEKYGNMLRQLQGLKKEERRRSPSPSSEHLHSPSLGLNLSYKDEEEEKATDELSSDKSESELADIDGDTIDDNISDENSMDCGDRYRIPRPNPSSSSPSCPPPPPPPHIHHVFPQY